ncbi:MAG TPA: YpmA family protein [Syntrophomonadaceae bacterium]|nr:YpmA family protein [Syntrophomonadaceae bacterium]HRX21770.1 YpmA family protein [Syntrophomonadaceae bacterium]
MDEDKDKLNLIAVKTFPANNNYIYLIDFLNKSLKEKRVMFGLTKDKEKNEMTVNIYEF